MSLSQITALNVAHLFLKWANDDGDLLSNLKLLKLLYYAVAWHYVYLDAPLFQERIEAWSYGPVVPEIYHAFKLFNQKPIIVSDNQNIETLFSDDQIEFLKSVYSHYVRFSANELVNMTHNEDPWKKTYVENENRVIPAELMKSYYSSLIANEAKSA